MRWIRLLTALVYARFRAKVKASETTTLKFTVWITDIDVTVMNHAAILTVFEMGRIDFMVRTNFFKIATENKWFFPSQAINVQFYRPLKRFQRGVLYTRMSYVDETYFYLEQKIVRNGKPIAACYANGTAKRGRETIPTSAIIEALNIDPGEVPCKKNALYAAFVETKEKMRVNIIENWKV